MKYRLICFFIIIISVNGISQIKFEKGYIIDNLDQKIECLIKNKDWKFNPSVIEYKLTHHSDKIIADIKSIKEFSIYNYSKYRRYNVNIDKSSEDLNRLSEVKKPIFKKELLFLRVLVEGDASLYMYEEINLMRYFYQKNNNEIIPLIFKSYFTNDNRIGKNNRYKQQLWNDLKHETISIKYIEKVAYNKKDLVRFFDKYNESHKAKYESFDNLYKRDLFNLAIRPGYNHSKLTIWNSYYDFEELVLDDKYNFRFGIEAEIIMPFNKNKWAFIIEPTYQFYKSEISRVINPNNYWEYNESIEVDYKSIEIPFGLRHYFFINNNSKLFVNGLIVLNYQFGSIVEIDTRYSMIDFQKSQNLEVVTKRRRNLAFGIGYEYNEKVNLELRFLSKLNILSSYFFWRSKYTTTSLIFGYNLF